MAVIRRHPVLTFFLLSYALCWAAIPWQSFFAPGVLVAALIVVFLTEGVAGLKAMGSRLIRWRVSWIWYALALAVPLAMKFAVHRAQQRAWGAGPEIAEFSVWYSLPMAIAINIVNPLNAQLPEESSFRGWAQPKLQTTRTPLAATVLMAVGVTIWHIPFFVMPQFGSSPIEATATVAVTFWYAWLFNHASASSLITLIAHATEGTIETSTLWPSDGRHDPDDVAVVPGLVPGRPGSAGASTAGSGPHHPKLPTGPAHRTPTGLGRHRLEPPEFHAPIAPHSRGVHPGGSSCPSHPSAPMRARSPRLAGGLFAVVSVGLYLVTDRSDLIAMMTNPVFLAFNAAYAVSFSAVVDRLGRRVLAAGEPGRALRRGRLLRRRRWHDGLRR